jgi:phosphate transport system protein
MAGYRREFDETLAAIEAEVIELFEMVADDLPQATAALLNGDGKALPILAGHQQAIDALYPQLEARISWEIMRQAPVASDLRFLLSVLTIARDFERAHRSVVHIAARAHHSLSTSLSPRCRMLVERMGDLAASMRRQAGLTECGRSAKAGRGSGGSPAASQIQEISGPLKHPAHGVSGQPVLISLIAGHFPRLNVGGHGR